MAGEANYYIDLILRAKDETASAITSAAANVAALNAILDESRRKSNETANQFEISAARQSTSSKAILELQKEILFSENELAQFRRGDRQLNASEMGKAVEAQEKLKRAVRDRVDAEVEGGAKLEKALRGQVKAQNDYAEARKEATGVDSQRHVKRITQIEEERRHEENLAKSVIEASKTTAEAQEKSYKRRKAAAKDASDAIAAWERELSGQRVREGKLVNKQIDDFEKDLAEGRRKRRALEAQWHADRVAEDRQNAAMGRAEQSRLKDLARDQEVQYKRMTDAVKALSKQKLSTEEFDKQRTVIRESREELARLGVTGQESMRKLRASADEYGVSLGNQSRLILQRNKNEEAHLATVKEASRLQDELTKKTRDYAKQIELVARINRDIEHAKAAGIDHSGLQDLGKDFDFAKAKAEELAVEIHKLSGQKINVGVDLDTGELISGSLSLEAAKKVLSRPIEIDADLDITAFMAKFAALEAAKHRLGQSPDAGWKGWLTGLSEQLEQSTNRISTFDNFIRGLTTLGIAFFFNQIVVLAGAAAGGLVALAGSAVYAGGALGGALVAGLAQATPMLAVFGSALTRVTAVFKAANQQELMQQQLFAKRNKNANAEINASDAIASAQEALASAHRRVQEAQEKLNDTRVKARNNLQELILAERDAALAARGAVLSQAEAQEALRKALSSGDTGSIERAQLNVDQSNLGVDQANRKSNQASSALADRRRTGVEGTKDVIAAKQALADAQTAAAKADRSLEKARRSAEVAGAAGLAAAGNLEFMLSRMSESEKRLYESVTKFQDVFRKASQNFTEPLINSFTRATTRIIGLLRDPAIVSSLRGLSTQSSKAFDSLFDRVSSPAALRNWKFFSDEAGKNVGIIAKAVGDLGSGLVGMAKAASPALNEMLKYLGGLADRFADFANSTKGQAALTKFFNEGVKHFKQWMSLLGAIGKLFFTVINPEQGGGATSGLKMLESLTNQINKLQKAAASPEGQKFLRDFFETSRKVFSAIVPIIGAAAKAFAGLFDEDGVKAVKGMASVFSNVLLPAFGAFLHAVGILSVALGKLFENDVAAGFAKWVLAGSLVSGILLKMLSAFRPLITVASHLFTAINRLSGGMLILRLRLLGLAVAEKISAMMTALGNTTVVLRARLIAMAAAQKIVTAAQWLWNAAVTANPIGLIVVAIAAFVAALVYLQRRFNIFGKAWDAIKTAFKATVNWLKEHANDLLLAFPMVKLLQLIINNWDKIKDAFKDGVNSVIGFMKSLPGKIGGFAKDAAGTIVDAFSDVGGKILEGIVAGVKGAAGFAKNIVNGIIGLVENAINSVDKIGPISVPDIHLPRLATGGLLGGNYAEGDRIPVMLAGEEAVLNPLQQAMVGRDRIMAALRATNAPIGMVAGRGYMTGVAGVGGSQPYNGPDRSSVRINADADSAGQARRWRLMWQEMLASTRRNANAVQERVRDMRVAMTATLKKLREDSTEQIVGIEMSGKVHFGRLGNFVKNTISQMTRAVFEGFKYIGAATNAVLKDFGSEQVAFSISEPTGNRAATGYIGQPGERGGDAIPILVGRGEAILNWGHQKMIEPALQAFYGMGLHDLFSRMSGFHAGGPQQLGAPGFAKGGFTGPFGSGAAFKAVSNFASRKFGLTMTSGRTNHGVNTASGNVSDHSWGGAGDFSNGSSPTPQMDAFNNFWKSKAPEVVKQLIWRNKDQFQGFPVSGHMDHVHLALLRQYAFDPAKMARIISRRMRGLSVDDLLAGNVDSDSVDHVDQPHLKGPKGGLRTIIFKAIMKARLAANRKLDSAFGDKPGKLGEMEHFEGGGNAAQNMSLGRRMMLAMGWPSSEWPALKNLWIGESGWNQFADNPTSDAYGIPQSLPGSKMASAGPDWLNNPATQIKWGLKYIKDRYGSPSQAFAAWNSRSPHWYARGGVVGGMPRYATGGYIGSASNVLSGINNSVRRLAIRRNNLYRAPDLDPEVNDYEAQVREYTLAFTQLHKLATDGVEKLTRKAKETAAQFRKRVQKAHEENDQKIVKNLTEMTKEGGLLDQIGAGIESYISRAAANLKTNKFLGASKNAGRNLRSVIAGNDVRQRMSPDEVAAAEMETMRGTLRRYNDLQKRLADSSKEVSKKIQNISAEIIRLEASAAEIRKTPVDKRTDDQKKDLKELNARIASKSGTRKKLIAAQRNLKKRTEDSQDKINETLEAIWQAQIAQAAKQLEDALAAVRVNGRDEKQLDTAAAIANTFGDKSAINQLALDKIEFLRQQQVIYSKAMAEAQRRGDTETAKRLADSLASTTATIEQSLAEQFVARLDSSIQSMAERVADLQLDQRVATSSGNSAGALGLGDQVITAMQAQAAAALRAAGEARAAGHGDLAHQYENQYKEIFASINEAIAAQFQARIDEVNKAADRARAESDRLSGLADTVDRLGGSGSLLGRIASATGLNLSLGNSGQMRQTALQGVGTALATQRLGLQQLLQEAFNPETIEALTDQLANLDSAIAENIVAQHENTIAIRQTAIDAITGNQQRTSGVLGGLLSLVQAAATNAGAPDTDRQKVLLEGQKEATRQGLSGLQDQLFNIFGIDSRGATGSGLADILSGLNYQAIESTMSVADRDQFRSLIDSIISLGTELETNTKALDDLNGAMSPQGFSSTAWNWFSQAIFDGMGNTMPQYTVPSFDTGGRVLQGGLAKLHTGEIVHNPAIKGTTSGTGGDTYIDVEVNEAGKVPDASYLAERVAFEYRNSRGNR